MIKYPFNIEITATDGKKHQLCCNRSIRSLEGVRNVFDAVYNDKPVIVKQFEDIYSKYKFMREKRGLRILASRNINVPRVLFTGKTSGHWCIVTEKISDAMVGCSILSGCKTQQEAKNILLKTFEFVGKMHTQGIVQKDMHLNNLLFDNLEMYAIDFAHIKCYPKAVSLQESCRQLFSLLIAIPYGYRLWKDELLNAYFAEREIVFDADTKREMEKARIYMQKRYSKRLSRKVMRKNKRVTVVKKTGMTAIFSNDIFERSQGEHFLRDFNGDIDKVDKGSQVFEYEWNSETYLVGCYHPKNWLSAMLMRMLPFKFVSISKARSVWVESWMSIEKMDVLPVVLLETHSPLFMKKSYFISKRSQ